ncbi:MAG: hypothetical protein IJA18_06560 [Ruminococcus sp.]|nr:hypothetical protein [Ruminococcus sp.]
MRSYEEIEKNAYKKAEIRLAEMRRRNTIIKRTALSSGICAAAIAGVWFVSGESTRDSLRKKHNEGIVTDEENPSEEYSGHIHLTTTTAMASAVSTTTAAEASTDISEEIPVTTSAQTTKDATAESPVTTTAKTTKDAPAETSVTTTAKTTEDTPAETSVTTTAKTTKDITAESPVTTTAKTTKDITTESPATTTSRTVTTFKRPVTTEVPETTTYAPGIDVSPQPNIATTTVTTDDGSVPVTTTTKGGWNYDSGVIQPVPTTTTAVPSDPEQPTVVTVNNSADAERIFTTYTDFDGIEYRLADPKKRPKTDKHLYVTLLSVYDPEKKIYYNAYVNMYSLKDSDMILMRNEAFSLYYEPVS